MTWLSVMSDFDEMSSTDVRSCMFVGSLLFRKTVDFLICPAHVVV